MPVSSVSQVSRLIGSKELTGVADTREYFWRVLLRRTDKALQTQLITLEVSLSASPDELRTARPGSDVLRPAALRSHIETKLRNQGEPLRWAITHVDTARQIAHVEAVVTSIAEPTA